VVAALAQSLAETAAAAGWFPDAVGHVDVGIVEQQVDGHGVGGVEVVGLAFVLGVVRCAERLEDAAGVAVPVFCHRVVFVEHGFHGLDGLHSFFR
jgi:hypothetical protein